MRQFRIDDSERDRILNLHESATKRQYLSEQTELAKINKAIQCFLNKKGIKDDDGNKLDVDGSIGRLPNSKSAQAIRKYQSMIKVYPTDGVWGDDTASAMSDEDKKIMKNCVSEHGDLFDKIYNFLFN